METITKLLRNSIEKAVKNGRSVNQIAKQAGVSQSSLSRWLNGKYNLNLLTAEKLYAYFLLGLKK